MIIRDDNGTIINQSKAKALDLTHANLDTIETAVEQWRKQILPEIEGHLLKQAQREFIAGEKTS